ncbi:hypothetical protein JCM8202v2_004115 [Rhodotorula sphaerocarpa]
MESLIQVRFTPLLLGVTCSPHIAFLKGPATPEEADAFLSAHKPSSATEVPSGWLWVEPDSAKAAKQFHHEARSEAEDKFLAEGAAVVERLTNRCAEIKTTAPVRANKAKGIQSQKQLREEAHERFNTEVKELAFKHNILTGKWLFYVGEEGIDAVWSKIFKAVALADGALIKTGAVHCAKTAYTRKDRVICVYCDNSWDKEAVGRVFRVLVEDLGLSDANTLLGIDSKHESGIRSSLWTKHDFMTKDEIDAALAAKSKAKAAPKKTLEDEIKSGAAEGFDPVSDSDEGEPAPKKAKKA